MTSPNVGKVVLGAEIDTADLHRQLQAELGDKIAKEVLPQIQSLNKEIDDLGGHIKGIKGASFEEVAKQAGVASREIAETKKATQAAEAAEISYRRSVLTTTTAIKDRATASSKAREEERKYGQVSAETQAELARLTEKASIAVQNRNLMLDKWKDKEAEVSRSAIKSQQEYHDAVERFRADEIRGYSELAAAASTNRDKILDKALKASDKQRSDATRLTDDLAREETKRTKAEADELARRQAQNTQFFGDLLNQATQASEHLLGLGNLGKFGAPILAGILELVGVAGQASKAIGLLPAGLAAAGAAALTFKLGLDGVDTALKAIVGGDIQKLQAALKDLAPSAQQFLLAINAAMPAFQELKRQVQQTLFSGLAPDVSALGNAYQVPLTKLFVSIAASINKAVGGIFKTLMSDDNRNAINVLFGNIADTFKQLSTAAAPFTAALLKITEIGSQFLPSIGGWITQIANDFNRWVQGAANSGALTRFLNDGFNVFKQLEPVVEHVVTAFFKMGDVVGSGIPDLVNLFNSLLDDLPVLLQSFQNLIGPIGNVLTILNLIPDSINAIGNAMPGLSGSFKLSFSDIMDSINPVVAGLKLVASLIKALKDHNLNELTEALTGEKTAQQKLVGLQQVDQARKQHGQAVLTPAQQQTFLNLPSSQQDAYVQGGFAPGLPPTTFSSPLIGGNIPGVPKGGFDPTQFASGVKDGDTTQFTPNGPMYKWKTGQGWVKQDTPDQQKKDIDNSLNPADYQVNPWANFPGGAPQVSGGALNVNVTNLPPPGTVGGLPGFPGGPGGVPGMPGTPGAGGTFSSPIANNPPSIAQAIFSAVTGAGYSPDVAKAAISGGLFESGGLNTSAVNKTSGANSLFQTLPSKNVASDPASQIQWLLGELANPSNGAPGGPQVANAASDPFDWFAKTIERGGYGGAQLRPFGQAATDLLKVNDPRVQGGNWLPGLPAGAPGAPPITGIPGASGVPPITMPGGQIPQVMGTNQAISLLAQIAKSQFGLDLTSGNRGPAPDPTTASGKSFHQTGEAGDFGIPGQDVNDPNKERFATFLQQFAPYIQELIYNDPKTPNVLLGGGKNVTGTGYYDQGTLGQHGGHVHVAVKNDMQQAFIQALTGSSVQLPGYPGGTPGVAPGSLFGPQSGQSVPLGYGDKPGAQNSPLTRDPKTGELGYFQVDTQRVAEITQQITQNGVRLSADNLKLAETMKEYGAHLAKEEDVIAARDAYNADQASNLKDEASLADAQRGDFKSYQTPDYSKLPYGNPQRILAGIITGAGGSNEDAAALIGGLNLGGGNAEGGMVIPGYTPGRDTVLAPLSGGEGIVIPEAMRSLGPGWLYGINSRFRNGLNTRKYGFTDGGVNGPGDWNNGDGPQTVDVLTQIRDLLATPPQGTQPGNPNATQLDAQGNPIDQSMFTPNKEYHGEPKGLPGAFAYGPLIGAAAGPIGQFAGNAATAAITGVQPVFGAAGPGVLRLPTPNANPASLAELERQRDPMALAAAAGINVPDYTRQGGTSPDNLTLNGGPPNDATGRIYSDTAALVDRTFTNMNAEEKARFAQQIGVLNSVKDRLAKDFVGPTVQGAVTGGIQGISDSVMTKLGTDLGTAAAGPIASAVGSAGGGSGGGDSGSGDQAVDSATNLGSNLLSGATSFLGGGTLFDGGMGYTGVPAGVGIGNPIGSLYDEGGLWPSGTFGTNLSGSSERVLSPTETTAFDSGQLGGWNLPVGPSGLRALGFTSAGSPIYPVLGGAAFANDDVSSTVGADFFGVEQVPILGAIVNLLVETLLKVIGVNIDARDTLNDIGKNFKDFRGDFKEFNARGQLYNDTSAIVNRSSTSTEEAAEERIRILKIVLQGLIKYIVEELIVPIIKAVGQALLQAGSGALSGGLGAAFPGGSIVGGIAGSALTSGGDAGINILSEVGTDFGLAASSTILDALGEGVTSSGLSSGLFGGGALATLFDPLSTLLSGGLAGVFGPFMALLGGLAFDDGGLAHGMGMMPKATIAPERVLSPRQTQNHERLTSWLDRNTASLTRSVSVGDIILNGAKATPEQVNQSLLRLLD